VADQTPNYPLRLEPIFQYRLWGGRKLEDIVSEKLPDGPVGEAWILSDRDDFSTKVTNGPFAGKTISELVADFPEEMLGRIAEKSTRYPLLLKYLDAREMLSVQVHPADGNKDLLPTGERGKTEAWVVLDAEPESKIFAGLAPGTTKDSLEQDLEAGTVEKDLASLTPHVGEGILIEAGTVHALGGGVVVFEVQQNSDVTFRLYDWNRVDEKTGEPRELHIEQALKCINFAKGPLAPTKPKAKGKGEELLFECEFFKVIRRTGEFEFDVFPTGSPRVLVCLTGEATLEAEETAETIRTGDVWFLPTDFPDHVCWPEGDATLLMISVP
jgi:mannose-6-phosphate isomerase